MESDNTINYLDITIHKTPNNRKTSIYRKPTFTDAIIPYTSNHSAQQKHTAVKFLYNRLNTYNLQGDEYKREENITQNIMHNSFPIHPQKPVNHTPRKHPLTTQIPTQKLATFTYIGKETTFITNTFRRTKLKIAFRTNNNIHNLLRHKKLDNVQVHTIRSRLQQDIRGTNRKQSRDTV
jgi:hypothetical protein